MAYRIEDSFNRPNSPTLGTAPGNYQWRTERGAVSISNGRAFAAPSSDSIGSFASVDAGLLGGDATVSATPVYQSDYEGGHALYFRVVDGNNWWRLSVRRDVVQSSYSTPSSNPAYWCQRTDYDYNGNITSQESQYYPSGTGSYGPVDYGSGYYYMNCYQNYDTYYYSNYYWELRLDRCVNGAVSNVAARRTDGNVRPNRLTVVARGSSISCSMNGGGAFFSVSDGTHATASRHGVGYSTTTDYSNQLGMDDFSIVPFVTGLYVPAVML